MFIETMGAMKTEISTFCKEFAEVLAPFNQALQETIEDVRSKPDSHALKHPLSGLSDVHHRMKTLVDKIEQQQAYVIIFGPLKSGKSTLMNAISSAYVSEVTSLPAYPCLVYVKHSEERKYEYTSYNGKKEVSSDGAYMQRMVRDGHQKLAERIRQVEENGEAFDPGIHYPEAIRRIDVEIPAKNLKDSLTVLVDTPGLYSKMRFGYDLMTREFRNSAACAVFIVKTDNLFLEQVFDEFNDLLGLFSRIFLVVNIDSNKRDLGPDGALRPSMESENPDRIIRAFESLAMSAPLRRAADEGRLRIYPIDLLSSAAYSLKEAELGDAAESVSPESDDEDGGESESRTAPATGIGTTEPPHEPFSEFMTDLTDYLNSNDYLVEFMSDSLRQGATLTDDIRRHCSGESLRGFVEEKTSLEEAIKREKERLAAVEKLENLEWEAAFDDLRVKNRDGAIAFSKEVSAELQNSLTDALRGWFDSDESLQELQEERLNAVLTQQEGRIMDNAIERVRSLTGEPFGGMRLDTESLRALDRLELSIEPILKSSSETVIESGKKPSSCAIHISSEKIPVRKNFWDWILFRSQSAVRRSVFGPTEDPSVRIQEGAKKKRLGEPAREALNSILETHCQKLFPDLPREYSDHLLDEYVRLFSASVREEINGIKSDLNSNLPDLEHRLDSNTEIQALLERISNLSVEVNDSIGELRERHATVVQQTPSNSDVEEEEEEEASGRESFEGDGEEGARAG